MSESLGRSDVSPEELADGMALWQEHRPQTPEDWIAVARRCNDDGADRSVMSPILAALCIVLDRLDEGC